MGQGRGGRQEAGPSKHRTDGRPLGLCDVDLPHSLLGPNKTSSLSKASVLTEPQDDKEVGEQERLRTPQLT